MLKLLSLSTSQTAKDKDIETWISTMVLENAYGQWPVDRAAIKRCIFALIGRTLNSHWTPTKGIWPIVKLIFSMSRMDKQQIA